MNTLALAVVVLLVIPWLALTTATVVLLLNRAPGHDLPLLPWWPSWDPEAYEDVGQRWLPWHKRATVLVFIGLAVFVFFLWLER
jgi:hypothetical protein